MKVKGFTRLLLVEVIAIDCLSIGVLCAVSGTLVVYRQHNYSCPLRYSSWRSFSEKVKKFKFLTQN